MQPDVFQGLQDGLRSGWWGGQVFTHRAVSILIGRIGHHIGLAIVADERVLSIDRFAIVFGIHRLQNTILSGLGAIFQLITG